MDNFFNSTVTPNKLHHHELLLKKNCPIMLHRNIDHLKGLCHGTHLICRIYNRNVIVVKIEVSHHNRKTIFIPFIHLLSSTDENCGFSFKMTQFLVKLSFTMTINK